MGLQIFKTEVNKILILCINKEAGMSASGMGLRLRDTKRVTTQKSQSRHVCGVNFSPEF